MTSFRLALARLGAGIILLQWFGNLVLILLALAWLQVPDSHTWQFLFSMVSSAVLGFGFVALHVCPLQTLRAMPPKAPSGLRVLLLLAVIVFGYFLMQFIGIGRGHEAVFAGYWNSKFFAGLRTFFTFERLVEWQDHVYDLLQRLFVAVILPIAFICAATGIRG